MGRRDTIIIIYYRSSELSFDGQVQKNTEKDCSCFAKLEADWLRASTGTKAVWLH